MYILRYGFVLTWGLVFAVQEQPTRAAEWPSRAERDAQARAIRRENVAVLPFHLNREQLGHCRAGQPVLLVDAEVTDRQVQVRAGGG